MPQENAPQVHLALGPWPFAPRCLRECMSGKVISRADLDRPVQQLPCLALLSCPAFIFRCWPVQLPSVSSDVHRTTVHARAPPEDLIPRSPNRTASRSDGNCAAIPSPHVTSDSRPPLVALSYMRKTNIAFSNLVLCDQFCCPPIINASFHPTGLILRLVSSDDLEVHRLDRR